MRFWPEDGFRFVLNRSKRQAKSGVQLEVLAFIASPDQALSFGRWITVSDVNSEAVKVVIPRAETSTEHAELLKICRHLAVNSVLVIPNPLRVLRAIRLFPRRRAKPPSSNSNPDRRIPIGHLLFRLLFAVKSRNWTAQTLVIGDFNDPRANYLFSHLRQAVSRVVLVDDGVGTITFLQLREATKSHNSGQLEEPTLSTDHSNLLNAHKDEIEVFTMFPVKSSSATRVVRDEYHPYAHLNRLPTARELWIIGTNLVENKIVSRSEYHEIVASCLASRGTNVRAVYFPHRRETVANLDSLRLKFPDLYVTTYEQSFAQKVERLGFVAKDIRCVSRSVFEMASIFLPQSLVTKVPARD